MTETANANTVDFPIHSFGLLPSYGGPAAALEMLIQHMSDPHDLSIGEDQLTCMRGVCCFINR